MVAPLYVRSCASQRPFAWRTCLYRELPRSREVHSDRALALRLWARQISMDLSRRDSGEFQEEVKKFCGNENPFYSVRMQILIASNIATQPKSTGVSYKREITASRPRDDE